MIKLRITLESKQDVIREIEINSDLNLEQFHAEIINCFGLDKFEMASFYMTDSNLDLGQEIPLFDTSEKGNTVVIMNEMAISSVLHSEDSTLIYVQDFLKMWRFHIQYVQELKNCKNTETICTKSVGEMPKDAPNLKFETMDKKEFNPYGDAFEDFDNYEY